MNILAIDIGSSSIKSAIIRNGKIISPVARVLFETVYGPNTVEIDGRFILKGLVKAVDALGSRASKVETIAIASLAPSWVAMDHEGIPLTPVVTHQDRRSVSQAMEIEKRVGKARHLKLAGNRPFPGGVSSTTWLWFNQNFKGLMKKVDLVGHVNTFLFRHLAHSRVTDPTHACFMGLYDWKSDKGWNEELMDAIGVGEHCLPQVVASDCLAGMLTHQAATLLGLKHGIPILAGCMDGSAGMLATGANVGQLYNAVGSTDVLALCTDKPVPHEKLLTRPLGIPGKWLSVSTLSAGGSTLQWAWRTLFSEMSHDQFFNLILEMAKKPGETGIKFEPSLAGDRMSINQPSGGFSGLTLGATREEMLRSILNSLAESSATRLDLLLSHNSKIKTLPTVYTAGHAQTGVEKLFHKQWKIKPKFKALEEANLVGLGKLV